MMVFFTLVKKLSFVSVNMCGREKNECLLVWGLLMSEYHQCENIILREKCVVCWCVFVSCHCLIM